MVGLVKSREGEENSRNNKSRSDRGLERGMWLIRKSGCGRLERKQD